MDDASQNRFLLVNIAAQRARQLMQGAEPLLRTKSRKPAAIAIKEIAKGLVPYFEGEPIAEEPWPQTEPTE